MSIARAGIPIILCFMAVHLLFLVSAWLCARLGLRPSFFGVSMALSVAFGLLTAFSLYFFRDPERTPPPGEHLVVSPADGRVLAVDEIEETEWTGGRSLRISIFMNVFSVHVNRFPVSGTVEYRNYRPGKFLNASLDKASVHNEAMTLGVRMENGTEILFRQIAGLVARRIVCDVAEGAPALRGDRFGMIRFGSRVEVFLPPGSRITVRVGENVTAGESILAELP